MALKFSNPVGGAPAPPVGITQNNINALWSYGQWGISIIAAFAALGCIALMWSSHRQGSGSNEGMSKLQWILGGCLGMAVIPHVIGGLTGT